MGHAEGRGGVGAAGDVADAGALEFEGGRVSGGIERGDGGACGGLEARVPSAVQCLGLAVDDASVAAEGEAAVQALFAGAPDLEGDELRRRGRVRCRRGRDVPRGGPVRGAGHDVAVRRVMPAVLVRPAVCRPAVRRPARDPGQVDTVQGDVDAVAGQERGLGVAHEASGRGVVVSDEVDREDPAVAVGDDAGQEHAVERSQEAFGLGGTRRGCAGGGTVRCAHAWPWIGRGRSPRAGAPGGGRGSLGSRGSGRLARTARRVCSSSSRRKELAKFEDCLHRGAVSSGSARQRVTRPSRARGKHPGGMVYNVARDRTLRSSKQSGWTGSWIGTDGVRTWTCRRRAGSTRRGWSGRSG